MNSSGVGMYYGIAQLRSSTRVRLGRCETTAKRTSVMPPLGNNSYAENLTTHRNKLLVSLPVKNGSESCFMNSIRKSSPRCGEKY